MTHTLACATILCEKVNMDTLSAERKIQFYQSFILHLKDGISGKYFMKEVEGISLLV